MSAWPFVAAAVCGCVAAPSSPRVLGPGLVRPVNGAQPEARAFTAGPTLEAFVQEGSGAVTLQTEQAPVTDEGIVKNQQSEWGLAAVVRLADVTFDTENNSVGSFVPMMFYEGDHLFLRGLSGGAHLWREELTELNILARARFFDIPAEFQNEIQGDTLDLGLQVLTGPDDLWVQGEWMSDGDGRQHVNARVGNYTKTGKFDLISSIELRYKTADFNDYYYALTDFTGERAGSGWELTPNVTARYHLFSDFYLLGSAAYRLYDDSLRGLSAIDDSGQAELMLGFGFFQSGGTTQFARFGREREESGREISTKPYLRVAHGWATPSSMGDILSFNSESDEFDNQLTSIFYGHPLTDTLFGAPIDVYLTPGVVWHHSSDVQSVGQEYVLAIKAYYTIDWPTPWRIGVAEGLSYTEDITYIERTSLEEKGYVPSELMNYLDVSIDLNLGDLFGSRSLDRLWLGYSLHHRSSIFESASQFGRIKGGSNYNTVYLQFDLY